ncbi:AAA family ATPase [Paracoccus sp. ME4]|uniref:AAA family ATPase n=1 Tax=Paracoccus sp. ME4 TaxID=3138066 RepID=UPI00398B0A8F
MRILSISGHNLASLEDQFEIRLDQEPLRSAGLFAITGKTGSGKSTLLDAMCLALYGDCPRLSAAGINDDVPDVSGENIKSRDARGILRRGASTGEARARFLADDGEIYEAGWTIRRARNRADGRLQNVERSLVRVSDGQLLENQIRTVNERVSTLLGLTYDEFRRTVLLAQGDFDAFLRADTADRAALLEKVTGTRIYRDISRRIYEREGEVAAALETLRTRMAEHSLLSDEDRSEVEEEATTLRASLLKLEGEAEAIRNLIRKVEEIERARQTVGLAETGLRRAEAGIEAACQDREALRVRDLSEPARADHQLLVENAALSAGLEKRIASLSGAEAEARTRRDAASVSDSDARRLYEASEAEFKRLGPVWTRATGLDAEIRSEAAALVGALRDQQDADRLREEAELSRDAGGKAIADEGRRRDDARAGLDRLPGFEAVCAARGRIDQLFSDLIRDAGLRTERTEQTRRLQAESRDIEDLTAPVQQQIEQGEGSLIRLDAELDRLAETIAPLEADDPQSRLNGLLEARALVQDLRGVAVLQRQELADVRNLEVSLIASRAELKRIEPLAEAARDLVPVREAVETEIQGALSRMELAVTEHAEYLRAQLEPGEACPVCGSLEHPVPDAGPFRTLVEDSRKRLAKARADTAAARLGQRAQEGALSEVAARIRGDEAALARLQERHRITSGEWDTRRAVTGLETVRKMIPAEADPDGIDQLLARMDARQSELSANVRELTVARAARDKANQDRRAVSTALEASRATLRQLESRKSDNAAALALAADRTAQLSGSIHAMGDELSRHLEPISMGKEQILSETAALHPKVIALIDGYERRRVAFQAAETALAELRPKQAGLETAAASAAAEAQRAGARAATRKESHDRLVAERSGLLDGVETETHRSRFNAERLRLQKDAETAAAALSDASGKLSAAIASREAAEGSLAECAARGREISSALDARIAETGLAREQVLAALEMGSDQVLQIRNRVQAIHDRRTSAEADLKSRNADLQSLLEALGPDLAPDAEKQPLFDERDRLDALIRSGREALGQKSSQLQRDDQDRLRLAGLVRDIRKAEAVRDTWRDVNAAVGSATGGKFSRIAQAVTLSILVELANEHLRLFKPRYRLAVGGAGDLALHVIDRDMADEVRSTRSLSGGERFLISLSLALALSGLGGRGGLSETLFIDEGFGTLDADDLNMAIDALETLQGQGRAIGVISHVGAMKDRIPAQIRVRPAGPGRSEVEVGLV